MTAAIMFFSGLSTAIGGALLRACGSGSEVEVARYWCGPQSPAMLVPSHAHCAGCAALASGLVLMIVAIITASLPRRRIARERA